MRIRLVALTLGAPPPATVCSSVIILSHGPLSGNTRSLGPTLKQSTASSLELVGFANFSRSFIVHFCDNVSDVYMSTNPVQYQCTKHIEIDLHFVRDHAVLGHCNIPVFGVTKIEETDVCIAFMHRKSEEFSRFKVKQSQ
jgi:hypothetical protein